MLASEAAIDSARAVSNAPNIISESVAKSQNNASEQGELRNFEILQKFDQEDASTKTLPNILDDLQASLFAIEANQSYKSDNVLKPQENIVSQISQKDTNLLNTQENKDNKHQNLIKEQLNDSIENQENEEKILEINNSNLENMVTDTNNLDTSSSIQNEIEIENKPFQEKMSNGSEKTQVQVPIQLDKEMTLDVNKRSNPDVQSEIDVSNNQNLVNKGNINLDSIPIKTNDDDDKLVEVGTSTLLTDNGLSAVSDNSTVQLKSQSTDKLASSTSNNIINTTKKRNKKKGKSKENNSAISQPPSNNKHPIENTETELISNNRHPIENTEIQQIVSPILTTENENYNENLRNKNQSENVVLNKSSINTVQNNDDTQKIEDDNIIKDEIQEIQNTIEQVEETPKLLNADSTLEKTNVNVGLNKETSQAIPSGTESKNNMVTSSNTDQIKATNSSSNFPKKAFRSKSKIPIKRTSSIPKTKVYKGNINQPLISDNSSQLNSNPSPISKLEPDHTIDKSPLTTEIKIDNIVEKAQNKSEILDNQQINQVNITQSEDNDQSNEVNIAQPEDNDNLQSPQEIKKESSRSSIKIIEVIVSNTSEDSEGELCSGSDSEEDYEEENENANTKNEENKKIKEKSVENLQINTESGYRDIVPSPLSNKQQNLSKIVEDTQKIIKQMKDEITSDMASYVSEGERNSEGSYESTEYSGSEWSNESGSEIFSSLEEGEEEYDPEEESYTDDGEEETGEEEEESENQTDRTEQNSDEEFSEAIEHLDAEPGQIYEPSINENVMQSNSTEQNLADSSPKNNKVVETLDSNTVLISDIKFEFNPGDGSNEKKSNSDADTSTQVIASSKNTNMHDNGHNKSVEENVVPELILQENKQVSKITSSQTVDQIVQNIDDTVAEMKQNIDEFQNNDKDNINVNETDQVENIVQNIEETVAEMKQNIDEFPNNVVNAENTSDEFLLILNNQQQPTNSLITDNEESKTAPQKQTENLRNKSKSINGTTSNIKRLQQGLLNKANSIPKTANNAQNNKATNIPKKIDTKNSIVKNSPPSLGSVKQDIKPSVKSFKGPTTVVKDDPAKTVVAINNDSGSSNQTSSTIKDGSSKSPTNVSNADNKKKNNYFRESCFSDEDILDDEPLPKPSPKTQSQTNTVPSKIDNNNEEEKWKSILETAQIIINSEPTEV